MYKKISVQTISKVQVINLDDELKDLKLEGDGLLLAFSVHSTAALILSEAETGLKKDFETWIKHNFKGEWKHNRIDSNASAHLGSGVLGQSIVLPVKDDKIIKGPWQKLLLVEMDGPRRERSIILQFINKE